MSADNETIFTPVPGWRDAPAGFAWINPGNGRVATTAPEFAFTPDFPNPLEQIPLVEGLTFQVVPDKVRRVPPSSKFKR